MSTSKITEVILGVDTHLDIHVGADILNRLILVQHQGSSLELELGGVGNPHGFSQFKPLIWAPS